MAANKTNSVKGKHGQYIKLLCVPVAGLTLLYFLLTSKHLSHKFLSASRFVDVNGKERTFTDRFVKRPEKPEVRHVGFLKVHKAGSSTIQNIFFRFGIRRNLTFVFPRKGHYFMQRHDIMPIHTGGHYDILATHSVFKEELFTVLPNDSINVAIIREPLDRMISAAYYYRDVFRETYLTHIPRDNFIYSLVNNPETYDRAYFSHTRNSIAKDFGFPLTLSIKQPLDITKHLNYLDARFKLVMLTERFEESLVLLKRLMNWGLRDIIYSPTNSHAHQSVANLSAAAIAKFQQTNFLDYKIYDTFKAKFEELASRGGPGFQQEVVQFKSILTETDAFCRNSVLQGQGRPLTVSGSRWNPEFEVSVRDCELMTMRVEPFITFMRNRHAEMNMITPKKTVR